MKRVVSIFFLGILLFNFAGFYLFFILQLQIHREQRRTEIRKPPAEELERIVLTTEQFEQSRVEEHEIKVNGRMYDLARVEVGEGHVIVYGVHDKKEDDLLALLDHIVNAPVKKKALPQEVSQFLSLVFLNPAYEFAFYTSTPGIVQVPYLESNTADLSLSIFQPPRFYRSL